MVRTAAILPALLLLAPCDAAFAQNATPNAFGAGPMQMIQMMTNRGPIVTMTVAGSVDAAPDMATINTGVDTRAPSAKNAMAQNAKQIDMVVNALLKQGIARKDIQTRGISLNPQYDYSGRTNGESPRFLGYQANNMLTVTIRKLDKAGETVDAMVSAGATNINGPTFSIADPSKIEEQARAKAIQTAQTRATFYAEAAGYKSARLLSISEVGEPPRPGPLTAMRQMSVETPATTIEPGQLSASITLNFRYMLEH